MCSFLLWNKIIFNQMKSSCNPSEAASVLILSFWESSSELNSKMRQSSKSSGYIIKVSTSVVTAQK